MDTFEELIDALTGGFVGPTVPVPKPTLVQETTLKKLIKAIATSAGFSPDVHRLQSCAMVQYEILNFHTADMAQTRARNLKDGTVLWWSCEWAREESTHGRRTSCVAIAAGKEMQACGKVSPMFRLLVDFRIHCDNQGFRNIGLQCYNVRYCSRGPSRRTLSSVSSALQS